MSKIQSLPVMLLITAAGRLFIVSHSRSITLSRLENASLRNPLLRISFQICSIGFISGVYGGMNVKWIFSGISSPFDLCHLAPSQTSRISSSGNAFAISHRNTFMQTVSQYGSTRKNPSPVFASTAPYAYRYSRIW